MKPTPFRARSWLTTLTAAALWLSSHCAIAQSSPYQYRLPQGWTHSVSDGVDTLIPGNEAAGAVQLMLMAPKPVAADFGAQFASERTSMEQEWGMRAPQASPPQQGRAAAGPYAAYFASYDSDGGARYMGFLASAQKQSFIIAVFVANDAAVFNRQAPAAVEIFKTVAPAGP